MNKDFSQHGEQEHILKFFEGKIGRFLDIGAFDGVTGSNTRALAELGWSGVCIEANPFAFQNLLTHCSEAIACVNAAVMDCGTICAFSEGGQLSTCLNGNLPDKYRTRKFYVGGVTPQMIATQFGDKFDFISLDVEGIDLSVLSELSPVTEKASLLCIEDSLPFHDFDAKYYGQLRLAATALGFSKVIARTPKDDGTGNTLLAKE